MTSAGRVTVCVLYPSSGPFDAIAQHACGLVSELKRRGMRVRYAHGGARMLLARALARDADWLFVEYMPYTYGRWGAAPGLVAAALAARLVPRGPRLALMVHEAPITAHDLRTWLMGTWQRWQLHALARLADLGFASTEANRDLLQAKMGRDRVVVHLPIPSNVPPVERDRSAARAQLGLEDDELAVAVFGGQHPSRALGHIEAALAATAARNGGCALINLGADPPALAVPERVRVIAPGPASPEAMSAHLAAADLYLAPFRDGTSSRRTTFAAALAHGLAVVGTDGAQTDNMLRAAPTACVLVPVDRVDCFVEACCRLAGNNQQRASLGRAAMELYEASFDWPVIGERLAQAIGAATRGGAEDPGLR